MTFKCIGCTVQSDPCRVERPAGTASSIESCEEALIALLSAAAGSYGGDHPSPSDLRRFLLGPSVPAKAAQTALKLLLQSDAGRRAVIQNAYDFLGRYPSQLPALVSSDRETKDVWLAFWRLPTSEGIHLDPRMRAMILASLPDLGESDLFADLSIVDPEKDLGDLRMYEQVLSGRRDALLGPVTAVREFLERCRTPLLDGGEAAECSTTDLTRFSPEAKRFIDRAKTQWIVAAAKQRGLLPGELMAKLRAIDYENTRTPSLHDLVAETLRHSVTGPADARRTLLEDENRKILRVFAKNDRIIAGSYANLLILGADEDFDQGRIDEAVARIGDSFDVLPDSIPSRVALVEKITSSPEWSSNTELREKLSAVVRSSSKEPWYRFSHQTLLGLFFILTGISLVWLGGAYAYRMRRISAEQAEMEDEMARIAEREELIQLRAFFEISAQDGYAALLKSYRRKAKESHPDVSESNRELFQELNNRFQRAKELMTRDSEAHELPEEE